MTEENKIICAHCSDTITKSDNSDVWTHSDGQWRCYPNTHAEPMGSVCVPAEGVVDLNEAHGVRGARKGLVTTQQEPSIVAEDDLSMSPTNPEAFIGWATGPR